jgi:hypothetical protein
MERIITTYPYMMSHLSDLTHCRPAGTCKDTGWCPLRWSVDITHDVVSYNRQTVHCRPITRVGHHEGLTLYDLRLTGWPHHLLVNGIVSPWTRISLVNHKNYDICRAHLSRVSCHTESSRRRIWRMSGGLSWPPVRVPSFGDGVDKRGLVVWADWARWLKPVCPGSFEQKNQHKLILSA